MSSERKPAEYGIPHAAQPDITCVPQQSEKVLESSYDVRVVRTRHSSPYTAGALKKRKVAKMIINYKTLHDQVNSAVSDHLMATDALPPNSELTRLAREITQLVFTELNRAGITEEAFDRFGITARPRARAQGRV